MLSDRIRHYRKAKKLTQSELSELLFVSPGYITEIEAGRRTPSLPLLMKLFDLLDCSPNDLFEYEGKEKAESDNCDRCDYRNSDTTISETVKLMGQMSPEAKFKVFSCAQDQEFISRMKSAN